MTKYVSMSIRLSSFVLLAALIGGATPAQAQSYPTNPVKIISDSAPGSAVDTNLRTIAEGLSEQWGQQVVIENRPGAGGAISATVAAEAAPDGYTIYAPALSVFLTIPAKRLIFRSSCRAISPPSGSRRNNRCRSGSIPSSASTPCLS